MSYLGTSLKNPGQLNNYHFYTFIIFGNATDIIKQSFFPNFSKPHYLSKYADQIKLPKREKVRTLNMAWSKTSMAVHFQYTHKTILLYIVITWAEGKEGIPFLTSPAIFFIQG